MTRRIAHSLCLLSSLILIGIAVLIIRTYPANLVLEIGIGTAATIVVSVVALMGLRKARGLSLDAMQTLEALTLLGFGQAVTIGAIHGLPVIGNTHTVYALHLGIVYRILHYAVTAYIIAGILRKDSHALKSEIGLVAIIVYAAMNGGLFQIGGIGFNLLWGLSLTTAMLYLKEQRPSPGRSALSPLGTPILAFLVGMLLSTLTSLYVHSSVVMLFRIGNWILVYFLIVAIVKEKTQVYRLMLVLLIVAIVVAVAGLWGTFEYAGRAGWANALRARIRLGRMYSNGVAVFVVAYAVLAFGLLVTWRSRLPNLLSGLSFVLLLVSAFFTYCRSAGAGLVSGLVVLILLRMPKMPSSSTRRMRLTLWVGLAVTFLLATSLVFTRTPEGSLQTRIILWKVSLHEIGHRPFTGVGLGNKAIPFFSGVLSHEEREAIKHTFGSHSHNLLVEIGSCLGLLGLGLFAWLIFAALRYSLRALRRTDSPSKHGVITALLAAMLALLVPHGLVLTLSNNTLLPLSFWVFLGLVVAATESSTWSDDSEAVTTDAPAMLETRSQRRSQLVPSILIFTAVLVMVVRPVLAEIILGRDAKVRDKGDFTGTTVVPELATVLEPFCAELRAQLGKRKTGVEAISEYRRASELRPYFAEYHARLAWLCWAEDRFDDATLEFEAASILDRYGSGGARYRHDVGLVHAAAGRREQALEAFQEAVLLEPSILRSPDWVGVGKDSRLSAAYARYARTHRVDDDLAALIDINLGRDARTPPSSTSGGLLTISLQNVAGGLRAWADSARGAAYSCRILFSLARMYQTQRMWVEMGNTLNDLEPLTVAHSPPRAEVRVLRAWAHRGQGRMGDAETELRAALLDYDDHVVRAELGKILLRMGKIAEATNQLSRAANSWKPDVFSTSRWALYWRDLARCHLRGGDLEDAVKDCDMALFLHLPFPLYAKSKLQIGGSYRRRQDYGKEREIYTTLLGELTRMGETRPVDRRLLQDLAKQMVKSHKRQGLLPRDALIQSAQRIEVESAVGKRYREFLVDEARRQLDR